MRRESERMRAEHSKVLKEQAATMTQSIHQAVQHALETSVDARVETSVTAAVTAAEVRKVSYCARRPSTSCLV